MSLLTGLTIGVSPITGRIYAGFTAKNDPFRWTSKVDVTDLVLNSVVSHLQIQEKHDNDFGGYAWSFGELKWIPKEESTNAQTTP